MYKPVPQMMHNSDVGEDSESELICNSTINLDLDGKSSNEGCDASSEDGQLLSQSGFSTFSLGRKIGFFLSVLNCLVFTVIFLWALPCDYDTCKTPLIVKDLEWNFQLKNKDVLAMEISPASPHSREVLILSSRGFNISSSQCVKNVPPHGLIAFSAVDGKMLWEKNITDDIQYLNCSMLDANNDGVYDCLIFTSGKGLSALDSLTGILLWELHSHQADDPVANATQLTSLLDLDAVLDLNRDNATDLVAVVTANSDAHYLLIISGRSGEVLGQRTLNSSCTKASDHVIAYVTHHSTCFNLSVIISGPLLVSGVNLEQLERPHRREVGAPSSLGAAIPDIINGIPDTQYLIHRGVNDQDYLVLASVNCSAASTVLRKLHF